jgi:hypothetical protein
VPQRCSATGAIELDAIQESVRTITKWNLAFVNPLPKRLDVEVDNVPVDITAWIRDDSSIKRSGVL